MDIPSGYEKASLLAARARELVNNAPTLLQLPLPKDLVDPLEIARAELLQGLLQSDRDPFIHGKNVDPQKTANSDGTSADHVQSTKGLGHDDEYVHRFHSPPRG